MVTVNSTDSSKSMDGQNVLDYFGQKQNVARSNMCPNDENYVFQSKTNESNKDEWMR